MVSVVLPNTTAGCCWILVRIVIGGKRMTFLGRLNQQMILVVVMIICAALGELIWKGSFLQLKIGFWTTATIIIVYAAITALGIHTLKDRI